MSTDIEQLREALKLAEEKVLKLTEGKAKARARDRENYQERYKRTGIKRISVLCHESLAKEIQAIAKKKTRAYLEEPPTNGSGQVNN